MTFQETEYPKLLREVDRLGRAADGPVPAEDILAEAVRLHALMPLYPGLVAAALAETCDRAPISALLAGDRVSCETPDGRVYGRLKRVEPDGSLVLEDVRVTRRESERRVRVAAGTTVARFRPRRVDPSPAFVPEASK